MSSNNAAFKTNFACTAAIRITFLIAVQFLCKHFIVIWLQSENTDIGEKKPPWNEWCWSSWSFCALQDQVFGEKPVLKIRWK